MAISYGIHRDRAMASSERIYNEVYEQAIEDGYDHIEADRIAQSEAEDAYGDYFDGLGDYQRDMREDR